MGGFIDLRVALVKGGMETSLVSENATFMPGNVEPLYSQWLAFSESTVGGRHPELLFYGVPPDGHIRHRCPPVRQRAHPN